jgi:hypothetical protein
MLLLVGLNKVAEFPPTQISLIVRNRLTVRTAAVPPEEIGEGDMAKRGMFATDGRR